MVDVLANKRAATRFRVLVEIAERQPAVSQGEIAEAVGVTSQAVSEYIRDLVDDGLVEKQGRSRYRVTTEGVDWTLQAAADVRRFSEHVTDDVLGSVQEDAAVATDTIAEGDTVSLSMRDGLQHATPLDPDGEAAETEAATGVATTDAAAGEVVGVTGFEGVIDLDPGEVRVLQVPSIRSGRPDDDRLDDLADACDGADLVVASGGVLPPIGVLAVLYLVTALLTNVISNNASVVLMIPVAFEAAQQLGVNTFSFVLAVTFAASTAFMTPVGYQTNLFVYGPGGYRFTDYLRVGGPLQLIFTVVTTLGIAFFWPL